MSPGELTVWRILEGAAAFQVFPRKAEHRVQILAGLNAISGCRERLVLLVFRHDVILHQGYDSTRYVELCGIRPTS